MFAESLNCSPQKYNNSEQYVFHKIAINMRKAKKVKSDNTARKYCTTKQSFGDLAGDVQKQIPRASSRLKR